METIPSDDITWSPQKTQHLQNQLVDSWAEDVWKLNGRAGKACYFHFHLTSPTLRIEIKYAIWHKFHSKEWNEEKDVSRRCAHLNCLVIWLNEIAPRGASLLEKRLEYWEWSLRSHLVETGRLKQEKTGPCLRANQVYVTYLCEDRRIRLLRQIYTTLQNAYDDRPLLERDIWDMRQLGLPVNLTNSNYLLNFTPIIQPWLRSLVKTFMHYRIAIASPADCSNKLWALHIFSRFLAQDFPQCTLKDIRRNLIVRYVSALRLQSKSVERFNHALTQLRVFLETCAQHLKVEALSKERIIFDDDFAKRPERASREIPGEVLEQLRDHLHSLETTTLRMVTILLEVGMRISELCTLPFDGLICDDKHEWYLRFYQKKGHRDHIVPLVNKEVIGIIQAQQQELQNRWGETCLYLFPSPQNHEQPYKQNSFRALLNAWAVEHNIRDQHGKLYHFTAHQFRHTVGMRLMNENVPLEVISRLFGHRSRLMTQIYARVKDTKLRAELERVANHRTVDCQGKVVKGDPRANDPVIQMTRRGIRGQTLPVGGCGRLVVLGECNHANKCLTCPMWLTSTDDLPALKSFSERAMRLKQRATETGNPFVIQQQEHIIANLAVRMNGLEGPSMDGTLGLHDVLSQLHSDLIEAKMGLEEAREAGLLLAAKQLEHVVADLETRATALGGNG